MWFLYVQIKLLFGEYMLHFDHGLHCHFDKPKLIMGN